MIFALTCLKMAWKKGRNMLHTCKAQFKWTYATSRKVAGSIPDGVIGIFQLTLSFRPHYGPGADSASNRNEYQEYFLGGKCGRCVGLTTLPPSCADCLRNLGPSTSWNPQGLPRPVKGLLYHFYVTFHGLRLFTEEQYLRCEFMKEPDDTGAQQ